MTSERRRISGRRYFSVGRKRRSGIRLLSQAIKKRGQLKTMLMQNFGVTNKEHYGMLWYFWSDKLWSVHLKHDEFPFSV